MLGLNYFQPEGNQTRILGHLESVLNDTDICFSNFSFITLDFITISLGLSIVRNLFFGLGLAQVGFVFLMIIGLLLSVFSSAFAAIMMQCYWVFFYERLVVSYLEAVFEIFVCNGFYF